MNETLKTAALTDRLRVWLRARGETPDVLASTLAYELAALIGRYANTEADAFAMIDQIQVVMKDQVRNCGVGVEHP